MPNFRNELYRSRVSVEIHDLSFEGRSYEVEY